MNPRVVLGIATLQYQKKMVDSLLQLVARNEGMVVGWAIPDCCLLPPARNKCIEGAYENNPDFTHLLFIDDDMSGFGPQHLWKLLENDKDICSAIVTLRKPPYKVVTSFIDGNSAEEAMGYMQNQELREVRYCGMAFTLIKRSVLDKMRETVTNAKGIVKDIWFNNDRSRRESFDGEVESFIESELNGKRVLNREILTETVQKAVLMGRFSHVGTELMGEDCAFCYKAISLGFKIWMDCGVSVGHIGTRAYDIRYALMAAAAENGK